MYGRGTSWSGTYYTSMAWITTYIETPMHALYFLLFTWVRALFTWVRALFTWVRVLFTLLLSIKLQYLFNRNIPMGTWWSNDVETTLFQRYQRWYNVVSTLFHLDVPAGIGLSFFNNDFRPTARKLSFPLLSCPSVSNSCRVPLLAFHFAF